MAAVNRTPEWIEREYGRDKWPALGALIEEVSASEGPNPTLGRVLARVTAQDFIAGRDPLATVEVPICGSLVRTSIAAMMGGIEAVVTNTLDRWCDPDTDVVVELGSGWSRSLLAFATTLGPRHARYFGAEYTDAGRDCADRLAALDPSIAFTSLAFDYNSPDLSTIRGDCALAFTVHSLEQIPEVTPALIDEIRAIAARVTCVHFEPVGWQLGESAFTSRAYAEHHDYNRNLWVLLTDEQRDGRLTIDHTTVDICGINPANASSVIAWSAVSFDPGRERP